MKKLVLLFFLSFSFLYSSQPEFKILRGAASLLSSLATWVEAQRVKMQKDNTSNKKDNHSYREQGFHPRRVRK